MCRAAKTKNSRSNHQQLPIQVCKNVQLHRICCGFWGFSLPRLTFFDTFLETQLRKGYESGRFQSALRNRKTETWFKRSPERNHMKSKKKPPHIRERTPCVVFCRWCRCCWRLIDYWSNEEGGRIPDLRRGSSYACECPYASFTFSQHDQIACK